MTETEIHRPINGDVPRYTTRARVEQKSAREFLETIDAILSIEGIESLRWEQYTPYFNDGDPCEFQVLDMAVKFVGDDEAGDYEDGYVDTWNVTYERDGEYPYRPEGVTEEAAEALNHISFDLNPFYDVLQDNFGDPAQVVATKEGFDVEFYEHD